jgi:GYF domain 2
MKYYIQRGVNEYGPYTLADLQRYVAQGNIAMGDLTRSEGMTEWVPVSQVLGDIPVPVTMPAVPVAGGTVYGGASLYGAATAPAMAVTPVPPDFHWALVLLLVVVTCTLFWWAWLIVEAVWIRKINPQSKGLLFILLALGSNLVAGFINGVSSALDHAASSPFGGLFSIASLVLLIVGVFAMRSDLENYYNTTENINLRLDGVGSALLTLFCNVFYFQWHFSRIAKWKKTGVLVPQS